jgi:hypothetical protein
MAESNTGQSLSITVGGREVREAVEERVWRSGVDKWGTAKRGSGGSRRLVKPKWGELGEGNRGGVGLVPRGG